METGVMGRDGNFETPIFPDVLLIMVKV